MTRETRKQVSLLCAIFVDESTRGKEVLFGIDQAVLVITRCDEDVQVLSLSLVREVVRAARQDRDKRATKSNVECRVDNLKRRRIMSDRVRDACARSYRIEIG